MRGAKTLLVALVLGLSLSGCSRPEPIRIATSAWAGVEVAELAARLGFYEKHGVSVQMVRFSAYSDSLTALRDGKVQAGMHTLDDVIRQAASGRDLRVVLVTDDSFGGDGLVARAGVDSLAKLRGLRVGAEIGTVGHYSLLKILERAGLTLEDITVVSIPAWEIREAFRAGAIDAGVTWEPYLTAAAQEIGGSVLVTSRDYPETIVTTMAFDATVAAKRPRDVRRVAAAYFEAFAYLREHPEEAHALMALAEGVGVAEFEAHLEGLRYLDLDANHVLFERGRLAALSRDIAEFLLRQGVTRSLPDTAVLLDGSFLPRSGDQR